MSNSSETQLGNPLLYSLPSGRRTLQPYWLIICQLIFIQFCQRLWNRWKYKTWFLQFEIIFMSGLNDFGFKLDFFDAFQTIWVTGHFVWYCILQGSCMSAANASAWRCFNIFGYVLMNYVIPSTASLGINIYTKAPTCKEILFGRQRLSETRKALIGFLCIWCYAPTTAIVAVIIVYFNVNIIPMFVCYEWIGFMWVIGVSLASVIIGLLLLTCPITREQVDAGHFKEFVLAVWASTQTTLVVYLAVILFNYSQYWYFGDSYIHAIVSEFESRDTNRYFRTLTNSSEQIAHTVLSSLG